MSIQKLIPDNSKMDNKSRTLGYVYYIEILEINLYQKYPIHIYV